MFHTIQGFHSIILTTPFHIIQGFHSIILTMPFTSQLTFSRFFQNKKSMNHSKWISQHNPIIKYRLKSQ